MLINLLCELILHACTSVVVPQNTHHSDGTFSKTAYSEVCSHIRENEEFLYQYILKI